MGVDFILFDFCTVTSTSASVLRKIYTLDTTQIKFNISKVLVLLYRQNTKRTHVHLLTIIIDLLLLTFTLHVPSLSLQLQ